MFHLSLVREVLSGLMGCASVAGKRGNLNMQEFFRTTLYTAGQPLRYNTLCSVRSLVNDKLERLEISTILQEKRPAHHHPLSEGAFRNEV